MEPQKPGNFPGPGPELEEEKVDSIVKEGRFRGEEWGKQEEPP